MRPNDAQGPAKETREVRSALRMVGADVEVADLHHPRHVPVHGENRPRHRRVVVDRRSPEGAPRRKEEDEEQQSERHRFEGNRCGDRSWGDQRGGRGWWCRVPCRWSGADLLGKSVRSARHRGELGLWTESMAKKLGQCYSGWKCRAGLQLEIGGPKSFLR